MFFGLKEEGREESAKKVVSMGGAGVLFTYLSIIIKQDWLKWDGGGRVSGRRRTDTFIHR